MTSNGYCKLCDGEPLNATGFCAKHLRLMERSAGDGSLERLVRAHYALNGVLNVVQRAIDKHGNEILRNVLMEQAACATLDAHNLLRPNVLMSDGASNER